MSGEFPDLKNPRVHLHDMMGIQDMVISNFGGYKEVHPWISMKEYHPCLGDLTNGFRMSINPQKHPGYMIYDLEWVSRVGDFLFQ